MHQKSFYTKLKWRPTCLILLLLSHILPEIAKSQRASERSEILLPEDPSSYSAPTQTKDQIDLNRLRNRRLQRENRNKPKISLAEKTNKKLINDGNLKRPYSFLFQVSLAATSIEVDPPRENYIGDLTSHFQVFWRPHEKDDITESSWWFGWRLAPFSGSGTYNDKPGRFGFLYFGPTVSYFGLPKAFTKPLEKSADHKDGILWTGNSLIWTMGISAQTRRAKLDRSLEPPEKDINTSEGAEFDSPGLHFEASYAWWMYKSFGYSVTGGVQLGEGKVFTWVGVNALALH